MSGAHKREFVKTITLGGDGRSRARCIEKASTTTIACPQHHAEHYPMVAQHRKGKHERGVPVSEPVTRWLWPVRS